MSDLGATELHRDLISKVVLEALSPQTTGSTLIALSAKVQQSLKASCPKGNMAMVGKYRRNVITLRDNIRWAFRNFIKKLFRETFLNNQFHM